MKTGPSLLKFFLCKFSRWGELTFRLVYLCPALLVLLDNALMLYNKHSHERRSSHNKIDGNRRVCLKGLSSTTQQCASTSAIVSLLHVSASPPPLRLQPRTKPPPRENHQIMCAVRSYDFGWLGEPSPHFFEGFETRSFLPIGSSYVPTVLIM